jgi:hypothetical protein
MRVSKLGLWILLIISFAFGQPKPCPSASCSTGILEPGGSYTGIDGITIKSSKYLDKSLIVYIERIEDASDLIPLSFKENSPLRAETAYYRISSREDYILKSNGSFSIQLPLPSGVAAEGLAVFTLIHREPGGLQPIPLPDATGDEPEIEDTGYIYWSSYPVNYDPETNKLSFGRSGLSIDGSIFTIVAGRYSK